MQSIKLWLKDNLKGDPVIWSIVLLLSLMSVLIVYSATGTLAYKKMQGNTEYYLIRHGLLVFSGLGLVWLAHKIDYRYYARVAMFGLWLSVPLLLYTYRFGTKINDAGRWITIPFIGQSFQPSDLAKLALITFLASMVAKRQHVIHQEPKALIPLFLWIGIICALIGLSNISTCLLLGVTSMLLLFIGRVPIKYLGGLVLVGVLVGGVALGFGERGQTAKNRVRSFVESLAATPENAEGINDKHFQVHQGFIAIASGGLNGKGPGKSTQRNFLPHPYSDFVYATIVEEYGFLGGVVVVFLYLALLYRSTRIVSNSDRAFGGLLAAGLAFSLVIQAMVNMGVAVGLGPVTGLPLPLLSMGGTSLLFTGIALGIIISTSRGEIREIKGMIK